MVTRWIMNERLGTCIMDPDEDGGWVSYLDHKSIAESHARLLKALMGMNRQFGYDVVHPNGMVHDEHEAIRAAIDAIAAAQQFTSDGG